jgi:hypothetical protein
MLQRVLKTSCLTQKAFGYDRTRGYCAARSTICVLAEIRTGNIQNLIPLRPEVDSLTCLPFLERKLLRSCTICVRRLFSFEKKTKRVWPYYGIKQDSFLFHSFNIYVNFVFVLPLTNEKKFK